jgi:hypothetical protein
MDKINLFKSQKRKGKNIMEKKWYTKIKKDDPQGLIIDENTGRNVAVAYDAVDAKLIAAAPEMLEALKREANYYRQFAEYGTATDEVREGHRKRSRDLYRFIYQIEDGE